MTLSIKEIEAITVELKLGLEEGLFTGVSQTDEHTLVLTVRREVKDLRLLICTKPNLARLHFTTQDVVPDDGEGGTTGSLAMALKSLEGSRVTTVRMRYHDRVVAIGFQMDEVFRTLLFECSGHHPNLFLLDRGGLILETLKDSRSRKRDLRQGQKYTKPLQRSSEVMDSMRFMGLGKSISAEVESYYENTVIHRAQAMETARLRRALKSSKDHHTRLAETIKADLAAQEGAARTLKSGYVHPEKRRRAERMAQATRDSQDRLHRLDGVIGSLQVALDRLEKGGEGAVERAEELLRSLARREPRNR